MTKFTADSAERVDKALAKHFPEAGRKQLAALFEDGAVKIGNKRAKKGDFVSPGDVIELAREPVSGEALRPQPDPSIDIRVLLERPDLLVLDKPAGVPSQPLRAGELGTVANAIAHRYPECQLIGDDPRDGGLVHRLDIGTSGILVVARTPERYRSLREAFGDGQVEKQYLALVEGKPVSADSHSPLAQRGKRVIVDEVEGLAAYTAFVVERTTPTHALVRCTAQTGRMHQVRAHLAQVGSPIAGDTLYGGTAIPGFDGFFLHAARIVIPVDGERLSIDAPLPDRFARALAVTLGE